MDIVSYGDRLRKGHYRVHSVYKRTVNFSPAESSSEDALASLVSRDVGSGPFHIVVSDLEPSDVRSLEIRDRSIVINGIIHPMDAKKRFVSCISSDVFDAGNSTSPERIDENISFLDRYLVMIAPEGSIPYLVSNHPLGSFETNLGANFRQGMELFLAGKHVEATRTIKGLGYGLTPSGDDFLSGLLVSAVISGATDFVETILPLSRGRNSISNSFLACAAEGKMTSTIKELVYSVLYLGKNDIHDCIPDVLRKGETSGIDTVAGLVFGLKNRTTLFRRNET